MDNVIENAQYIIDMIPVQYVIEHNDQIFIQYQCAMNVLGKSNHIRQLDKRKSKYPLHIITLKNIPYISFEYFQLLFKYFKIPDLKVVLNNE